MGPREELLIYGSKNWVFKCFGAQSVGKYALPNAKKTLLKKHVCCLVVFKCPLLRGGYWLVKSVVLHIRRYCSQKKLKAVERNHKIRSDF